MRKDLLGYSLIEIIVIIVLVGILASFALPNFGKGIQKSDERAAVANLAAIKSGIKLYLGNTGLSNIPNWGSLSQINAGLSLKIIDNKMTYDCRASVAGNSNHCSSTHPGGWAVQFHDNQKEIHCGAGTCPSCTGAGCGV